METKLCQLLPNLGGRCVLELNPNPTTDNFGKAIRGGQLLMQRAQNFWCRQRAVLLPCLGINRQTIVFALCRNSGFGLSLLGLMMGSVVEL